MHTDATVLASHIFARVDELFAPLATKSTWTITAECSWQVDACSVVLADVLRQTLVDVHVAELSLVSRVAFALEIFVGEWIMDTGSMIADPRNCLTVYFLAVLSCASWRAVTVVGVPSVDAHRSSFTLVIGAVVLSFRTVVSIISIVTTAHDYAEGVGTVSVTTRI